VYIDSELNSAISQYCRSGRVSIDLTAGRSIPTRTTRQIRSRMAAVTAAVEGGLQQRYISLGPTADAIEELAIHRAKNVFRVAHANVQPLSGTSANLAALFGLCSSGERLLAMSLRHGGHLSHGFHRSLAGKVLDVSTYELDISTQRIDYDAVRSQARRLRPRMIVAGSSSFPRKIDYSEFANIAEEAEAILLLDISHHAGFVAAGLMDVPRGDNVVITLTTYKTLCGPRGAVVLCAERLRSQIERSVFPLVQGSVPLDGIAAKAAVLGDAVTESFRETMACILDNAVILSEELLKEGITLVAGGTDTHMIVVDLGGTGRTGLELQWEMREHGIVVDAQALPTDPVGLMSGIRLGLTSVSAQNIAPCELRCLGRVISDIVLRRKTESTEIDLIRGLGESLSNRAWQPLFQQLDGERDSWG
jgi:glycine hydroxymethyltransferase